MSRALAEEVRAATGEQRAEGLWLAAFAALAHRYGQEREFDLEITLPGRGGVATETREVEVQIDGDWIVRDLIRGLSASLAVREAPGSARAAALPVALTFFETTAERDRHEAGQATAAHDLRLVFVDHAPEAIVYNGGLFLPDTIARLAGHLTVLLTAILRDGDCRVARLPLLTAEESRELLVGWRSARTGYPPVPLHRYVEAHAAEQPGASAVTFNGAHLSYGDLDRRANRLAHELRDRGVTNGTRVAVCLEPSFDIAICILAIFKAGGTHVPLDPSYPRERLAVILDDVQPRVVLAHARAIGNLPRSEAPILLLDQDADRLNGRSDRAPSVEVDLAQPAFIVYTSGTTGKPKGVVMTHGNLVHYVLSARDRYGFGRSEVMPAVARFTFSITMFEVLLPLVAGGRLIVLEREHVLDLRRLVQTLQEATAVHVSPSLWRKVLAYLKDQGIGPQAFPRLRHASSGGDLVSADLVEGLKRAFTQAEVFVIYGCSEIACMGCTYFVPRDRTATRSRVGKPFDNVSIRLCDPHGNLVPIGIVGEIYFGGAGVALGYLNRDDLTKERFVTMDGERFYRTGDLGRYDADGNVEILGRSDFQIKLRGIRIELGDVETTLRQAPGVREAVAAARDLGGDEKSLVGYLVPSEEPTLDVRALRQYLHAKLPEYMVPAVYVVLQAMPVNLNNKLDRAALPAPTAADFARLRSFDPPRDDRERKLATIWESVLGVRPIGIRDNFFDIGGDSLQSVTLMVEIEKAFRTALPLSTVLTDPTIEKVAALLGPGDDEAKTPMVLLRKGSAGPPVFFVHDGEGEVLPYRNLAFRLSPVHPIYGIRPVSRRHHPMMHTRISDLVDDYTAEIRRVQPKGPYLLSGLCIGGFIAFEIARKLEREGDVVGAVVLIDAAHVTAREKSLATRRFRSFSTLLSEARPQTNLREQAIELLRGAVDKASNLVKYEVRTRIEKQRNRLKMRLLRLCLDHALPRPTFVHDIPVRVVLRFAEKEYVIPPPYAGEIALLRATKKDRMFDGTLIDDTPYVDLFVDPMMEWQDKVAAIEVHDLPGGHSSMLVEPYVQTLAVKFQDYLDRALDAIQASPEAEKANRKTTPADRAA